MRTLKSLLAVSLVTLLLAACTDVITQPSAAPTRSAGTPGATGEASARPSAQPSQSDESTPPRTKAPETAEPETAAPETASPEPHATETAPPTDTPAATAAPPTPAETSGTSNQGNGLTVNWKEVSDPGFGLVYDFLGTASANGTFVAIGEAGENLDAAIWVSSDGRHWQAADFPDSTSGARLAAVTAGGPGFVAVGSQYSIADSTDNGVAWTSVDGQSWQRVDSPLFSEQSLEAIDTATGTLVAFSDAGRLFTSTDGATWQVGTDPTALAAAHGWVALAGDGSTLWVFSHDQNETRPSQQQLDVWQTTDGVTWRQTGTIDGSQGIDEAHAAAGPNGLVLIASTFRRQTTMWETWFSVDGATWQPALQSPTDITDVLADEAGFVAVGHYNTGTGCAISETDDVGVTWTSVDGLKWRQMSEKGWQAREVQVLTLADRTLIGLGVDYELYYEPADNGTAWTSELPPLVDDQAAPPPPTPEPTPNRGCGP